MNLHSFPTRRSSDLLTAPRTGTGTVPTVTHRQVKYRERELHVTQPASHGTPRTRRSLLQCHLQRPCSVPRPTPERKRQVTDPPVPVTSCLTLLGATVF